MMQSRQKMRLAFAVGAVLASGGAAAQQAGDFVLGAGWLGFWLNDKSTPLTFTSPINQAIPGSGSSVDDASTLGLTGTYYFNSNWGVELVVGIPPTFELNGAGSLAQLGKLGEAKQWSPAVLARYTFGDGNDRLRPYLGLGLSYIWFNGVNLAPSLQNAIGGRLGVQPGVTSTTADIDSRYAPVFNLGATYQIDRRWGVALSVSYLPLKTTARLTTRAAASGATVATAQSEMTLNPITTLLQATYRF